MNEAEPYFYVKNLMGDICEIVDKNGVTVATYQYDAWGDLLNSEGDATILQLNPFTYCGYIYDSETKLYYLQSRYYNPEWNRFLNADTNLDTQTSIIGTNVFAYGDNNPVMNIDPTGQYSITTIQEFLHIWLVIGTVCLGIGAKLFGTSNGDDYCLNGFYVNESYPNFVRNGLMVYFTIIEVRNKEYCMPIIVGQQNSWMKYYHYVIEQIRVNTIALNGNAEDPGSWISVLLVFFYSLFNRSLNKSIGSPETLLKQIEQIGNGQYMALIPYVKINNFWQTKISNTPIYHIFSI